MQDPLFCQPVRKMPNIIAVVSCAQQSSSTCQSDDNTSVVLQSIQHKAEPINVMLNDDQPSTSSLQDLIPYTMTVIDHNGNGDANQEDEVFIESSDLNSPVLLFKQSSMRDDDDFSTIDDENVSPNTSRKRSGPINDIKLTKSEKRYASSEMKFREFSFNWSKISDNIIGRLNRLQDYRDENPTKNIPLSLQLPKADTAILTNTIVEQLRCIDTEIPACTMERVARQIYSKYTGLKFVDDDGYVNHQSHVALKHKLINRNSYLNRFKNPDGPKISALDIRRNKNVKAGTLKEYWVASSTSCSKDILSKLNRDDPKILNEEFLSASQPYLRFRLDEPKLLNEIVIGLPILRRRQLISFHFEKATGVSMLSLEKLFVAKRLKIVDFLRSRPKNLLPEAHSDYDIIAALCALLGENVAELIVQKEIGTQVSEITIECTGPVIVAVDLGNDSRVFYVFAEQTQITEGTNCVVMAISDLVAVHYIYNFMYMKNISKFLEFVQTYFFKIIPTTGSKSKATRKSKQQRLVQSVIEAISNHVPKSN
ncbi:uncharacterized protein LOC131687939 [Topomyia yanbarensis]|uniref:uncharacterized protein LOC131687939 n=1 Tax=Topomyia yanbarensis TaxID=2498891 RepID=UPI00273CC2AF|nr:uncharacterized protein LOC131687939 [Topomyia yanbarensis]